MLSVAPVELAARAACSDAVVLDVADDEAVDDGIEDVVVAGGCSTTGEPMVSLGIGGVVFEEDAGAVLSGELSLGPTPPGLLGEETVWLLDSRGRSILLTTCC